jgi:hypothetical protein
MNFFMSIAIWLAALFGGPAPGDEELFDGGGEQQAMSGSAHKKSTDKKHTLSRKGYIYNGF